MNALSKSGRLRDAVTAIVFTVVTVGGMFAACYGCQGIVIDTGRQILKP